MYTLGNWPGRIGPPTPTGDARMRIAVSQPLFAWDCLDDSPSLKTVREFLAAVPDGALLAGLQQWRGRGRNDYPVTTLWGTVLLTILLRHPTFEACLGELRRNAGLRRLIGIDSEARVPKSWNVSRFLEGLGHEPHRTRLREIFDAMVRRLGTVVEDLGVQTAGDASWLSARRERSRNPSGRAEGLPPPAGGRKEYTDDEGKVVKVVEWFGYKFHVLVDTRHEVILAYQVTSVKAGDNQVLPDLLKQAQGNLPKERIKTLAYDKAADDGKVHRCLHKAKVKPLIQIREQWTETRERMLPGHDGNSNIVYDEAGTVYCYDKVSTSPVRHRMAYIGHEAKRGTLKYRCPAMHGRWSCPSHTRCNAGKRYGLTTRVKREIDLRRFPPIPRATKQFERLYKGRTAVERVIARTKIFWGADDGNIAGGTRFYANVGAVMIVHAGLATLLASTSRRGGPMGTLHLSKVAKALQAKLAS